MFEKINIRGVDFANVMPDEAVEIAKSFIADNEARVIYTPNAEITQDCINDKTGGLYEIINSADMVIPDGAGVVLASKILKTPLRQKVAGIELAYKLIDYLDEINGNLFLLGSKEEIVEKAAANLNEKYKNLKVVYNNGYFDHFGTKNPEENITVIEKINSANPDVVFVCFGGLNLKQEKWIFENKSKINKGLLIGLGGTIDTISGMGNKRAPKIFIKLNLEWFYRLLRHPSRIGRMMKLPKFVFGTMFAKKKK